MMNMKKAVLLGVLLTAGAGHAFAAQDTVSKMNYVCDNNNVLEVVYINTAAGNAYAIINQVDEMIPMKIMKMGSGANYEAINKNYTYKLYTKGKTANLVEENDNPVFSNCTAAN